MSSKPTPDAQPHAAMDRPGTEPDGEAELDARVQEALGRSLKSHYDDLLKAPIPDRFLVLLAELEAREQADGH